MTTAQKAAYTLLLHPLSRQVGSELCKLVLAGQGDSQQAKDTAQRLVSIFKEIEGRKWNDAEEPRTNKGTVQPQIEADVIQQEQGSN